MDAILARLTKKPRKCDTPPQLQNLTLPEEISPKVSISPEADDILELSGILNDLSQDNISDPPNNGRNELSNNDGNKGQINEEENTEEGHGEKIEFVSQKSPNNTKTSSSQLQVEMSRPGNIPKGKVSKKKGGLLLDLSDSDSEDVTPSFDKAGNSSSPLKSTPKRSGSNTPSRELIRRRHSSGISKAVNSTPLVPSTPNNHNANKKNEIIIIEEGEEMPGESEGSNKSVKKELDVQIGNKRKSDASRSPGAVVKKQKVNEGAIENNEIDDKNEEVAEDKKNIRFKFVEIKLENKKVPNRLITEEQENDDERVKVLQSSGLAPRKVNLPKNCLDVSDVQHFSKLKTILFEPQKSQDVTIKYDGPLEICTSIVYSYHSTSFRSSPIFVWFLSLSFL